MATAAQKAAAKKKADLAALLAGLGSPEAAAAQQGGIFIGVGAGSETETRLGNLAQTAATQNTFGKRPWGVGAFSAYKTGTELDQLAGFGTEDIYALQVRLYQANLLDSFVPGQMDSSTRSAFKDLLAMSNAASRKWTDVLDQIGSAGGKVGAGKAARQPFTAVLTSEQDLKDIADAAALSIYGGKLNDQEMAGFVSTFRQHQLDAQQAQYNAEETGGVVDASPTAASAQNEAVRAVEQAHPDQVFVSALGAKLKDLTGTIGQPGGGSL